MADQGARILDLTLKINTANTDQVVIVFNAGSNTAQTALVGVSTLLSKLIPLTSDPANNSSVSISAGGMFRSNSFLYVATANNYTKRFPLADW